MLTFCNSLQNKRAIKRTGRQSWRPDFNGGVSAAGLASLNGSAPSTMQAVLER